MQKKTEIYGKVRTKCAGKNNQKDKGIYSKRRQRKQYMPKNVQRIEIESMD